MTLEVVVSGGSDGPRSAAAPAIARGRLPDFALGASVRVLLACKVRNGECDTEYYPPSFVSLDTSEVCNIARTDYIRTCPVFTVVVAQRHSAVAN
ncbi:hypothetical protein EVAR_33219_1 [Eumeta japonica]|uniref:Uncharacterized protein n=1 Tax=Eumeta variegata TaxID=151549 RepID=A0A4C1W4L4_EUMVA|nr:hypothetical protein EVAR_33219_1 [Eumeta japonica]